MNRDRDLRGKLRSRNETRRADEFVVEAHGVETEAAKIVAQKDRASNFGVDGFSVGAGKGQAEGKRRELIEVGHKSPAVFPQRLYFQLLFVPALILPVFHAEVGVTDDGVLEGTRAKHGALRRPTQAEVLETGRGVHPRVRRPVKSVADDEALAVAIPDHGNQESGLTDMVSRR